MYFKEGIGLSAQFVVTWEMVLYLFLSSISKMRIGETLF